jgi:hypothetical protein
VADTRGIAAIGHGVCEALLSKLRPELRGTGRRSTANRWPSAWLVCFEVAEQRGACCRRRTAFMRLIIAFSILRCFAPAQKDTSQVDSNDLVEVLKGHFALHFAVLDLYQQGIASDAGVMTTIGQHKGNLGVVEQMKLEYRAPRRHVVFLGRDSKK